MRRFLATVCLLIASAEAFYRNSKVIELDPSNFQQQVIKSDAVWIIEFYAEWCGHCKQLAPEWKKAAKALNGVVNVGAVNAATHQQLGQKYGVQGFPTIKIFGDDKRKPSDYQGGRTAKDIVDAAMSEARKVVRNRMGGKSTNSKKSKAKSGSGKPAQSDEGVVTLTDANFNENVMKSDELWMVEFYAPWCGHCKNLAPEWAKAAQELDGTGIRLAALDATKHTQMAQKYGIQGYPTIKYFLPGSTSPIDAKDYQGPREARGIVAFATKTFESAGGSVVMIPEFTEQQLLDKKCSGKSICVIAFLPHLLDSKKKGREDYIAKLEQIAKGFRGKPYRFGWIEGGAQEAWETSLGLTFGFPSLVALNFDKNRFALQRGAFSDKAITKFLNGITSGSVGTEPLPASFGKLKTVKPWDGKEAQQIEEDDKDDDIMRELLSGKDEL